MVAHARGFRLFFFPFKFFEFLVCFSCFSRFFMLHFPILKLVLKRTCFWDGGGTFLFFHVCSFVSSFSVCALVFSMFLHFCSFVFSLSFHLFSCCLVLFHFVTFPIFLFFPLFFTFSICFSFLSRRGEKP